MKVGSRVAIIGVGQAGAAAAYALILGSVASEILVVDTNIELRDGQVSDLSDVAFSSNRGTRVRAASHREAAQCDIVVIAAGSKYMVGQTSLDSLYRNVSVVRGVISAMRPFGADTILLVLANPVDLLTSLAQQLSGLPASRVIGSGTFLDSVRLRGLLAERAGVAAKSIDIYVLGVHGDSQVVAWSTATLGGVPLDQALPPNALVKHAQLDEECKLRSQMIIRAKGSTPLGIGSVVARICSAILRDQRNVHPVSHFQPDSGCCYSLPVVLGRQGVMRTIQMPFSDGEQHRITESSKALKNTMDRIMRDQ